MKPKSFFFAGLAAASLLGISQAQLSQTQFDATQVGLNRAYFVQLKDNSSPAQNAFIARLAKATGGQYQVVRRFDKAFTGLEVVFNSKWLKTIGTLDNVASVYGNATYSLPESSSVQGGPVSGDTAISSHSLETMGLARADSDASGKGVTIGILDTGLFSTQIASSATASTSQAFRPLRSSDASSAHFGDPQEDDTLATIKAGKDFIGKDATYINSKIPFAYDYANGDNNVQADYTNDHGTHVASLAAANGSTYQGIAPKAQLAILKVFQDGQGTTSDDIILSALEDAADLKLDVINLSLGQALVQYEGWGTTDSPVSAALDNLKKADTIVNFSAGNEGRAQFGASSGFYADKLTGETVETSEMGAYALLHNVNTVASSTLDVVNSDLIELSNGSAVAYKDMNTAVTLASALGDAGLPYQKVPGVGSADDFQSLGTQGKSVAGKIAVIDRGQITFTEKIATALAYGASGVAIVNTDDTLVNFSVPSGVGIPVIQLTSSSGAELDDEGTMTFSSAAEANALGRRLSDFSSDGPANDLGFNPDIAAPGDGVLGAVLHGYEEMSGTSMAAPNFTGAVAYALSASPDDPDADKLTFNTIKESYLARIQSTADPLQDDSDAQPEDGLNYASPRRQGAGLVNLADAVSAKVYAESLDESKNPDGHAKLQFKTDADFSKGIITPSFNVVNETGNDVAYKASVYVAVPEARVGMSEAEWEKNQAYFSKDMTSTMLQTTDDHLIGVYEVPDQIVVAKNATQRVTFSLDATKAFQTEDGKSALEDYVNAYYPYGTYLEGYVTLTPVNAPSDGTVPELSLPYSGFYGDYGAAPAYEAFDFQKEDGVIYNSDIQSSVMRNLSGGQPNADYGSALYVLSSETSNGQATLKAPGLFFSNLDPNPADDWNFGATHLGFDPDGTKGTPIAGVKGKSDVLAIQQFMNRSAIYGKASLVSPSGSIIQSTYLRSYPYSGASTAAGNDLSNAAIGNGYPGYPLMKSFITTSGAVNGYGVPVTVGALELAKADGTQLVAGTYSIQFEYLLAATDNKGQHYTQIKNVPIVIATQSNAAYQGFEATGTAFRFYVSDDTVAVYDAVAGAKYDVQGEEGQKYVEVPVRATDYGYVPLRLVSKVGEVKDVLVNVNTNGSALLGTSALDFYSALGNSAPSFHFVSKIADKDGKIADFTFAVENYRHDDVTEDYAVEGYGFALNIGTGKAIGTIQYLDPKTKSYKAIDGNIQWTYNASTGLLSVENLPEGVVTIRISLK